MSRYSLQVGGQEAVVNCAPQLERQANSLLELLDMLQLSGEELRDGETVQFGWVLLTLVQRGDELVVHEPDFDGDPFTELREDLTASLTVTTEQAQLLGRLGLRSEPARFQQNVVIGKDCLQQRRVYLEHKQPVTPNDSGWYIGPVEGTPQEFESIHVYQLLRLRPSLLQALTLPPGYLVVFDGDEIKAVLDERGADVWQGTQ